MKTKMKFIMSLLLIILIAITSCSKDGDVGPIGPAGIAGTNGADGIDGDDGVDGVDGNANVFASDWLEPNESSFSVNNARSKALPFTDNIGSSIRNEGVVLVYYDNDVEVKLLPHYSYNTLTGSINKSIESKLNHASRILTVSMRKYSSDFTENEYLWNATGPAYAKGVRFRYIIIPSSTTSGKSKQPDFKKMNYNEVIDHFNLEY